MNVYPIENSKDYGDALARIEKLMDTAKETSNELDVLSILVAHYEAKHWPTEIADPVEAIKFRMEQQKLKPVDLIPFIGSRCKVSEVLSGKRGLSLSMRQKLPEGLGIPAAVMLGK